MYNSKQDQGERIRIYLNRPYLVNNNNKISTKTGMFKWGGGGDYVKSLVYIHKQALIFI